MNEELAAGIRHVAEYAGSRLALADALDTIMMTSGLQELILAGRLAGHRADSAAAGQRVSGGP